MKKRTAELNCALALDKEFNFPHKNYPVVYVTGTDGKGSTSSMIASILTEAGYKVGTFNTPGIKGKESIVKINGKNIPRETHNLLLSKIRNISKNKNIPIVRWVNLYTCMAYEYFKQEKVDIAVIETSKGCQTDPTNVITPIVSVLTNITPDHLEVFDNSFDNYIVEKCGIVKSGVPCLVGETPEQKVLDVLNNKAKDCGVDLLFTDRKENNQIIEQCGNGHYKTTFGEFTMSLGGDYQFYNLNLALNTILELRKQGYAITNEHVISGLERIFENTGLCGRWQVINESPKIILDAGHTYEAWKKAIPQLLKMKCNKLHIIATVYNNRDVNTIANMFPDDENIEYWFPKSTIKRLRKPSELMKATSWMKKSSRHEADVVNRTIQNKLNTLDKNDVVFIAGNTEYATIVNKWLMSKKSNTENNENEN